MARAHVQVPHRVSRVVNPMKVPSSMLVTPLVFSALSNGSER
jgi:hypothetical protein